MKPLIIEDITVLPGENKVIDINVNRLPSGTRIYIKAHVYRSKIEGPTLLLLGGIHGDEINGIEIVRQIIDNQILANLKRGTVIAISLLNVYGFINSSREMPDGRDVNRSFPGVISGSLASRVAACLTKKILPHVNYAIDFHTGGASRYNYPQIRYSKQDPVAWELAKSFAAPFIIQKPFISKSFRKTANEMKIPVIVYEAGESERLCGLSIELGYKGTLRTMKYLGLIDHAPDNQYKIIHVKSTGWVRASEAGLLSSARSSGIKIGKLDRLAEINAPQADRCKYIIASKSGYIIGHNNAAVVQLGDALFHIAYDYEVL
jgi:uncharacterized protein